MHVGHDWLLTPERVAVHRPSRTAVVADLHLGYCEARRRRGEAVPCASIAEQLLPLYRVLKEHNLARVVIAGDLLEDYRCNETRKAFQAWLTQHEVNWIAVVPGNHDAKGISLQNANRGWQLRPEGVRLGVWHVVHGDAALPDGPVVHGHEHPYVRWSPKRRAIRPRGLRHRIASSLIEGPCYLAGPQRLILPAYSAEAAGVNILSSRRWRAYRCFVVAADRVLALGEVATLRLRLAATQRSRPGDD
jgi:metallophosphoesterase superfamily enzyme